MSYSNKDIANALKELAQYARLDNANPFKIRAYEEAASVIENYPISFQELVEKKEDLTKIPHIGVKIAKKIKDFVTSGEIPALKRYKKKYPSTLLELLALPGLGPKKVMKLYKELGISSLEELQKALEEGKLDGVKGFGKSIIKHLKEGLIMLKQEGKRFLFIEVEPLANEIVAYMQANSLVKKAIVAGSFRRKKETIGDLDLVVVCKAKDNLAVLEYFTKFPKIKAVINKGDDKSTIVLHNNLQIDMRLAQKSFYGSALNYFTGSKAHTLALRKMAKEQGWKINEYGIFNELGELLASKSEKSFYKALGMDYIEPELREMRGEIEAARAHNLPKLIKLSDIRGDLHMHTTFSDGAVSLQDMVAAAFKKGYSYIAITDHSQHIALLNGMDEAKIIQQAKEIKILQEQYPNLTILQGVEVDILEDGSLALSDDILKQLDIVIASIHDHFNFSKKEQTKRILKAISNRYVNIIGHISGRLLQKRQSYNIEYESIFKAAKEHMVALEINSQPRRLDITDLYAKKAKEMGVKFAINSDAHHINCLNYIQYGINQARRGWLEREDVINSFSLRKLRKFLKKE